MSFYSYASGDLSYSNLGKKKSVATGSGTLSTTNATFVTMLIIVIVVIGALSFLPAMVGSDC
ncbi:potassium-transporting ATPase subunit KdpA [Enterococcus termitis]